MEISTVFFVCYAIGLAAVAGKRARMRGCIVSPVHRAKQIKVWLLLSLLLACGMVLAMRGGAFTFIILYGLSLIITSFLVTAAIRLIWKWQDKK